MKVHRQEFQDQTNSSDVVLLSQKVKMLSRLINIGLPTPVNDVTLPKSRAL